MGLRRSASAIAALGILAAGCGTVQASTQTTTNASVTPANVVVCRHYRVQRAWVKGLAMPTMGDGIKFATWVGVDSAQAQHGTPLARDLGAMSADEQALKSSYAASARVRADCRALGVRF